MGHVRLRAVFYSVLNGVCPVQVLYRMKRVVASLGSNVEAARETALFWCPLLSAWTSYVNCQSSVGVAFLCAKVPTRLLQTGARKVLPWLSFCVALRVFVGFWMALFIYLRPQIERDPPAELKHINKRRKRNQQGFP